MVETVTSRPKATCEDLKRAINEALRQRRADEAEETCRRLIALRPEGAEGWVFLSRALQQKSDFPAAFEAVQKALALAPRRLDVRLVGAEACIYVGKISEALKGFEQVERDAGDDPALLKQLAALYTQLNRHQAAYRVARALTTLEPESLNFKYLRASTAIALGRMGEAEGLLDQVIAALPEEGDIYYHRATLRRQTPHSHHVDELNALLARLPESDFRTIPLHYALGKELEDMGDHGKAFAAYSRGAAARKARLAYDVSVDERVAAAITRIFDAAWWRNTASGSVGKGPVFVLGLPRSGTTLVDRILSAHSAVASLGEVNDVAYGVVRAGAPAKDKIDLIRRSAAADMDRLGGEIWAAFQGYGERAPYLIDKTPANFLYLGLIAKALPEAKIIHVRRHPLASGFAMYKTLFRMGYPFSYDLTDIGRYYLGYHRLMAHWTALFPERILTVAYEDLVDDQERVSRAMIAFCGLEWEEGCLDFHRNQSPTATASAAQVRGPIYRDSRDLWRVHEEALQPLAALLKEGGVSV